jgi:hypothetical protein
VREKFLADRLPAAESPEDYDANGNVQLGPEYTDWFRSAENGLRDRVVLATTPDELLITSPLPGSIYVVDPDVPSSARIPLVANGGGKVEWQSDSLTCHSETTGDFAVAAEGEHRLVAVDPATGKKAETRIRIRSL